MFDRAHKNQLKNMFQCLKQNDEMSIFIVLLVVVDLIKNDEMRNKLFNMNVN